MSDTNGRIRALGLDSRRPRSLPPSWGLWQRAYVHLKWMAETLFAVVLLLLAAPLILVAALLVRISSAGPALYSQVRMGRLKRLYTIHKIRTMKHNCEKHSGPCWSVPGDPRITTVGRFLRRTHLDELPQLWNVLRGQMALVGPRPERPEFVPQLEAVIDLYGDRLLVRPGMTGLAQVQLPPDTDLASVQRKLAYDLYYVHHMSPWLDLRILVCTGLYVLGGPLHCLSSYLLPSREKVEGFYQQLIRQLPARSPHDLDESLPGKNGQLVSVNGSADDSGINGEPANGSVSGGKRSVHFIA